MRRKEIQFWCIVSTGRRVNVQRIVRQGVPSNLLDMRLIALDMGVLMAGMR
jgi:hypothetical protein